VADYLGSFSINGRRLDVAELM